MSDIFEQTRQEIDSYAARKKAMEASGQVMPQANDVFEQTRKSVEDFSKKREQDLKDFDYIIPLRNDEYDAIRRAVTSSDTPDEDAFKYASALTYSKEYGISVESALGRLDEITKYHLGKEFVPRRDNFTSIMDSFTVAKLSTEYGKLASKWRDSGEDPELGKQLDEIARKMDSLKDRWDRPTAIDALKFGAALVPFATDLATAGVIGAPSELPPSPRPSVHP
jgi:hypothetical protein